MGGADTMIEEDAAPQAEKPRSRRKLLLIAGPVVLLLVAASVLWFSGALFHHNRHVLGTNGQSASEVPTLIDVPDIITNLDNGTHKPVFVKLKARIEVPHSSDQVTITASMPQILDAFQTYLRSCRPEDLHGGEGTYRLREALMNRIDIVADPVRVSDVLFIELLIQ